MLESIEAFAAAAEGSELAKSLKYSRWGYAITNTAHVLGVALLVGAILPLDLRLMGAWGRLDRTQAVRLLFPIAAAGLIIAVVAGAMLFAVRAVDYVQATLFYWKFALIAVGSLAALTLHARAGFWIERATPRQAAIHGALSLACWLGALVCGRFVAYFPY